MRIDMPMCSFTDCRHNQDHNCFAKGGNREGCEFRLLEEKNKPKKCKTDGDKNNWFCPNCEEDLMGCYGDIDKDPEYCLFCGQALKWGE